MNFYGIIKKIFIFLILISFTFGSCAFGANYIYQNISSIGPGTEKVAITDVGASSTSPYVEVPIIHTQTEDSLTATVSIASKSEIYVHDGIAYVKGESMGQFSLSGFCACNKCGTGTGLTASGKPVRENHTIAADWKVLPKGTVIILENANGKDGTNYDGVYVVEDKGGGVKNNHIDIYRPTHDLAKLVTHYGRAYGDVYIAEVATSSEIN